MKRIVCAFVLLCAAVSPLFAGLKVGGDAETYAAGGIHDRDLVRGAAAADADVRYVMEQTEFCLIGRAETDSCRINNPVENNPYEAKEDVWWKRTSRAYLKEGFVRQDFFFDSGIQGISLKAGKIIYTWGNADEIKPVDILNPQDLSFLILRPIQERKYGAWSGDVTVTITDTLFIEGVVLPWFTGSDYGSDAFCPQAIKKLSSYEAYGIYLKKADMPGHDENDVSYACRAGAEIALVDMHLNYYYGYDQMPVYFISMTGIVPEYKKLQMIGYDFQRALFGGITVRGECAFFERGKFFSRSSEGAFLLASPLGKSVLAGEGGIAERKSVEYTAGFDVNGLFVDTLYANFQCNEKIVIGDMEGLAADRVTTMLMGTLDYGFFDDKLHPRIKVFYVTNTRDTAFNGEFKAKVLSSVECAVGAWVIEGRKTSDYGQYDDRDFVYFQAKVVF